MTTKVAYGDGLKLLNNVEGTNIIDPISLEPVKETPTDLYQIPSMIINQHAFNTSTIKGLFGPVIDDSRNGMNMALMDFDEFMGEFEYRNMYPMFNFMNTGEPKFKEDLKKIWNIYSGGKDLGEHRYDTRSGGSDALVGDPIKYEIKDEVACMKKRKRKSKSKSKKHKKKKKSKKKHTKLKKKRKSKSKMR